MGVIKKDVENMIAKKISTMKNTAFVNSMWIEFDDKIKNIKNFDTVIVYSGFDWESTNDIMTRRMAHRFLEKNNKRVVHIGNTYGKNYFSFWLYFVYKNLHTFLPKNINIGLEENHKSYMCLNRKPHKHRIELVDQLHNHKLIEKGYVTLGFDKIAKNKTELQLPLILDVEQASTPGADQWHFSDYESMPEADTSDTFGIPADITSLGNVNIWNKHFLNVVTETVVHSDVFVSEKTYKPILGLRPFVILGDNKIYDVLHDFKIDTFDDLFGTWYKEKNYKDRISEIINVVQKIESLGMEKRHKLYKKLEPRLVKNQSVLIEQAKKFQVQINID